ncbi:callose synthase 10-like [Iris pallida]|uniref:Callose synthase 10-like n=1 Tax=Iris pallida TaxID=29817 RepID=A0AAX6FN74_IRIPA|nr:callose synthase 10-like [Iris pallida]
MPYNILPLDAPSLPMLLVSFMEPKRVLSDGLGRSTGFVLAGTH